MTVGSCTTKHERRGHDQQQPGASDDEEHQQHHYKRFMLSLNYSSPLRKFINIQFANDVPSFYNYIVAKIVSFLFVPHGQWDEDGSICIGSLLLIYFMYSTVATISFLLFLLAWFTGRRYSTVKGVQYPGTALL